MVCLGIRNQFCRSHQRLCTPLQRARPKSRPAQVSMFDALGEPPQEAYASSFYISVQTGGKGRGTPPCAGPLLCFLISISSFSSSVLPCLFYIPHLPSFLLNPWLLATTCSSLPFRPWPYSSSLQALVDQRQVWILWWCWRERSEGLGGRDLFNSCLGSKFLNSNIFQLQIMKTNFTQRNTFPCHSLLLSVQGMDENWVLGLAISPELIEPVSLTQYVITVITLLVFLAVATLH